MSIEDIVLKINGTQFDGDAHKFCTIMAEMHALNHPPHQTPAQFLLEHGERFRERRYVRAKGEPKMCFQNAYYMATTRKNLRYVEGFATSVTPIEHGWCIDWDGRVIDTTLNGTEAITDPSDYFGMVLDLDLVKRVRKLTRAYSVLFSWWSWRDVYPLLLARYGQFNNRKEISNV